ncbi:hypothetical protein QA601_02915 [Chitinispirillales bacterium ANBcel5]|uniref:hypothetical protein n=1 Tax=Cellulosispirillum alkaliphilum TaxID=3039283 RepID=UPI002A544551|nr:hypothetical protein [Chitinispirillales bacterium ANBcel5]
MSQKESSSPGTNMNIYTPTPEAKALEWDALCPSTKKALEKIIHWLNAASDANQGLNNKDQKGASKYEAPSTSILVAGDRGSGKTTVLLSAAYMYSSATKKRNCFLDTLCYKNGLNYPIRKPLENSYEKVTWLNTLDLEPLQPDSNLLAAMLVRIREVVQGLDYDDSDGCAETRKRRPSILEGDLGTEASLNQLITEATYMWEGAHDGKSRSEKASEQIKAAEIYANFQHKFKKTMENTICLMKERRKQAELFVFPIDNVDRSIEHISNISKLIRLAASHRIWFILAAVRPDYQLFLERSFQNELLKGSMGGNASNWDQTQAIARRQAATSMRRSLPEKYQILIKPLEPEYCWNFSDGRELQQPPENQTVTRELLRKTFCENKEESKLLEELCEKVGMKNRGKRLCDQLSEVELCLDAKTCSDDKLRSFKTLADLFTIPRSRVATHQCLKKIGLKFNNDRQILVDAKDVKQIDWIKRCFQVIGYKLTYEVFCKSDNKKPSETHEFKLNKQEPIFTGAGKMALGLSMRTLLDLKATISVSKTDEEKEGESAVEVAVKMLRNAIDESDIPFWASDQLLSRIVRKNSDGKWVLDLSDNPIEKFEQTPQFNQIYIPENIKKYNSDCNVKEKKAQYDPEVNFIIEESLKCQHFPDLVLQLRNLEKVKGEKDSIPLPTVITGWFMILHDILKLRDEQRVISDKNLPNEVFPAVVKKIHKLIFNNCLEPVKLVFGWKPPEWRTFVEHFLFAELWTTIIHNLESCIKKQREEQIEEPEELEKKKLERLESEQKEKKLPDEQYKKRRDSLIKELKLPQSEKQKETKKKIGRILRLAWVECICIVFSKKTPTPLDTLVSPYKFCNYELDEIADKVKVKLKTLVNDLENELFGYRKNPQSDWLLKELPLFLGPEYSHLDKKGEDCWCKKRIWSWLEDEFSKLEENWKEYETGLNALREEKVRSAISESLGLGENDCSSKDKSYEERKDDDLKIKNIMKDWFKATKEDDKFWSQRN